MNKKIFAFVNVFLVVGIVVLGMFYHRLVINYNDLRKAFDELERLDLTVDRVMGAGYSSLKNSLWNETKGAYQVTSSNPTFYGDDNYLAYIFHTEYHKFKNDTRADKVRTFLKTNPPNLELGQKRWIVLSSNYSEYSAYSSQCQNGYADKIALNGIFFARMNEIAKTQACFDALISEMYDTHVELIKDNATEENGHEYYKIALSLILAHYLNNSTYIQIFTRRLIQLQRTDGSWLTDDKDMETTYPNTETTLLILLALDYYRN